VTLLDDTGTPNITYSSGWDTAPGTSMLASYLQQTLQSVPLLLAQTPADAHPAQRDEHDWRLCQHLLLRSAACARARIARTHPPHAGAEITVLGSTAPTNGLYTAALDGAPGGTFNGSAPAFRAQQVLFYASALGPGPHTLALANAGGGRLDLDAVQVAAYVPQQAAGAQAAAPGLPAR
jgi:hypothetical protein